MRQLKDIQVFYAFHFDSSQRTSTKHEHGSYHVPWNSRNVEMSSRADVPEQLSSHADKDFHAPREALGTVDSPERFLVNAKIPFSSQ
jgi:hypothetical protein